MPLKLCYWKIRGLASSIRYQLAHSEVEYDMVEYEQGEAPDYNESAWLDVKNNLSLKFPSLPYIIDGPGGEFSQTDTALIHMYLADQYKPELLGSSPKERSKVNMLAKLLAELKVAVTESCYVQDDKKVVQATFDSKMPDIISYRGYPKSFLAGHHPTWIDFLFLEIIEFGVWIYPDFFAEYPSLKGYTDTVKALPGLWQYLDDPDCKELTYTFNNKNAKINNGVANCQSNLEPQDDQHTGIQHACEIHQPQNKSDKNKEDYNYDQKSEDSDPDSYSDCDERDEFTFENGNKYKGQWKGNMRYGYGSQIFKDGSKYSGYWKNCMAHGKGCLVHADGDKYEGNWKKDVAQGHGKYTSVNGSKYVGNWVNDKQHGEGKETWPDGAMYEGNYNIGKKDGHGKFQWADGSKFDGGFVNNDIHGQGNYIWADGRDYKGGWVSNKMEGSGLFTWADGRMYDGEYHDDKKHGRGKFWWPDGRSYDGQWINGKQNGYGIYKTASGMNKFGQWSNGKREKWITEQDFYDESGIMTEK